MLRCGRQWLAEWLVRPAAGTGKLSPQESFDVFDADGLGFIDALELQPALKHYGIDLTEGEAQEILVVYDSNPDGKLFIEMSLRR